MDFSPDFGKQVKSGCFGNLTAMTCPKSGLVRISKVHCTKKLNSMRTVLFAISKCFAVKPSLLGGHTRVEEGLMFLSIWNKKQVIEAP